LRAVYVVEVKAGQLRYNEVIELSSGIEKLVKPLVGALLGDRGSVFVTVVVTVVAVMFVPPCNELYIKSGSMKNPLEAILNLPAAATVSVSRSSPDCTSNHPGKNHKTQGER
jgi:hypothetical protein